MTDQADPRIDKSVVPGEACIGSILDFTITVPNEGTIAAEDVVVRDSLPEYLDVVEVTATRGTVSIEGRSVVVVIGSIAPGEVITIHIRARLNQLAQPPVGRNSATLSTSSTTDDPTNNTASVEFGILSNCTPSIATEIPIPPELPHTGAADGPAGSGLPLALLGLLLMVIGLSIRRRNAR